MRDERRMRSGPGPFSPRPPGSANRAAHMTKRRAESASPFCSVAEKKRCGSLRSPDSPPPVRRCTAPPDPCTAPPDPSTAPPDPCTCRKRPSRPEPLESLPEPKKTPLGRTSALHPAATSDSALALCSESGVGLRPKRARGDQNRPDKDSTENQVVHSNDDDDDDDANDQLCAFNSFQFWRVPLPELDLSLLDTPASGDADTKDSTEAMET